MCLIRFQMRATVARAIARPLREALLPDLPFDIWAISLAITLFAGFVKGAVGFAMPLIMVSGLTAVMDPRLAVAAIILPIVISNGLQTFRTGIGPALEAVRGAWRYVVSVCIAIAVFAQFVPHIDPQIFYLALGIPVVIISLVQLLGVRLWIPPRHRWWAEWLAGLVSGVLGGLAGTWGPTTILYLLAIDTPKMRQIVVQGVIYGAGSVTLLLAHLTSGVLNAGTAPFSALMVVPALAGMWLGFKLHDRLDQVLFRRAVLAVLIVAGVNLVRKGLGL
jgi:uncharacterized protein